MTSYYKQLHRHQPEEGLIGDCWRTCIANLLGLKPQAVPHFVGDCWGDPDPEAYRLAAQAWLAKRNLRLVEIFLFPHDGSTWKEFGDIPYILIGNSPNFAGIAHAVIGHRDFQVLFDPAESNKGLLGPLDIDGQLLYSVGFLVPINLTKFLPPD